jgi:hypothetical protein
LNIVPMTVSWVWVYTCPNPQSRLLFSTRCSTESSTVNADPCLRSSWRVVVEVGVQLHKLQLDGGDGGVHVRPPVGEGLAHHRHSCLQRSDTVIPRMSAISLSTKRLLTNSICAVNPSLISSWICFNSSSTHNFVCGSMAPRLF